MRAIRINNPGDVEIIDVKKPICQEGEALLKILYGGICGSDLNTYRGLLSYVSYPRIPGHEFSGEILEVGENEYGLKPGMIVTANPYFNCGKCYSCRRGLVNCCESNETMGVQRDGAFMQYITMPIDRIYDGEGLDARLLAMVEPFCISYHGVKRANIKPGDRVLIMGAGTIGVFASVAAKKAGAEVYISDVVKDKLTYADEHFNVDGTILNSSPEVLDEAVKDITNGDGFDVTIEAVGLASTFQNCIDAVCYGGRMVQIGVGKKNVDFNFTMIQKKELNIFGSRNAYKNDFLEVIDMIKDGSIDIFGALTNMYQFEDAAEAFEHFDSCQGECLKVMLDFTK